MGPNGAAENQGGGLDEMRAHRVAKVAALRNSGVDPYPSRGARSHLSADVRSTWGSLSPGEETEDEVTVAGRLMLLRRQGKLIFANLRDSSGDLQLFVSRSRLGDEAFELCASLDLGDWVQATGTVMVTKAGELSVGVDTLQILSKALRPLPDKWHGLNDQETRYRQRYVDLMVNEESRRVFGIRARAIASLRRSLSEMGFVEVETPILHHEPGGATARPFSTHHNALDLDLFLRVAPELHLKRLVVGGMERVFEIGRVFRNEGIDTRHNPEFTILEAYQALTDYSGMMDLVERLITTAAVEATGGLTVPTRDGDLDLSGPWARATMADLIEVHLGMSMSASMPLADARACVARVGLEAGESWGPGRCMHHVYDELVERRLNLPTFVIDHPAEVSPLAKRSSSDPDIVERFELIIGGSELANAYSELNDPIDQRHRFEHEQAKRLAGDLEAGSVDEDYLRALEFGLPPTGGMGIGIDRLVMLFAGVSSIREVVFFPTLKPETDP